MHFTRDRAAAGALDPRGRKEAGLRPQFIEVFGDRQSIPDLDTLMGQAGDQKGRRKQKKLGARRGVVAAGLFLLERQAGELA
jgi:hypothetical protein